MKLNPIIKLIIPIFITIAVAAGLCIVLKTRIEASAEKIYESRSMLKVLENRDANYAVLKANYPIVKEGLPVLRQALPKEDDIDKVVSGLENLAVQTNNVQTLEFEPISALQSSGQIRSVNFSVKLVGNAGTFEEYFKKLQKFAYPIEVSGVNIKNDIGVFNNNSQLTFKAKFNIK